MAANNSTQPRTSGDSLEKQVDKIMSSLSVLNKLLTEDPLGRSKKQESITKSNNQKGTLDRSQSAPPALALVSFDDGLIMRLQYHLRLLKKMLAKLEQLHTNVQEELNKHLNTLQSLIGNFDSSRSSSQVTYWIKLDLQGMETKISDLLNQVPLLSGKLLEEQKAEVYADQDDDQGPSRFYFPGIHTNVEDLTRREVFRQVKQKFKELGTEEKICLLSFAVFPENQEVHRTMLMYWWIGEGILPLKEAEVTVRQILKSFTEKNLIEPVEERWKVSPSSYKMSPFVHSSVVILSKEIGLFDIYHQGKKPMMNISEMGKVCLVEGSSRQLEANPKKMPSRDHIETVFNVSERLPDFTFNWFSEYPSKKTLMSKLSSNWFKTLKVFYLGRWERSKKRHIQVQNPQLMQCLNHLRNLKVLSFQGISGIRSLNSSVCKLHKLIILDLRECYDLKQLPVKIGSLGSLVYLDMTGCYMLEWIPLRLALLKNLEVLKGFVVSDVYEGVACKLSYLKKLKKLRKLSIEINRDDVDVEQVMEDLVELKALTSLKVTWRRDLRIIRGGKRHEDSTEIQSLWSHQLKKLNLQRYPHDELPTWLLVHLKKLQIGGGRRFKGFGDLRDKENESSVEVLRLKSLPKLRVGWIELRQLFPNLMYLENYECPRVTLTPCDGSGIWRSDQDN
ncbi:unnamed protein product [Eruca vesicaria subsp. sativa]|uniref:Disease resistance R13L4/SHOC-2-like LRR domain-containing protein n=1 Tax=Eruca vesicaria subsp. sativa TaxID=29727 RepID=A0ABC8K2T3_ERUVS|nr:unnamed protein product [Eruca vesicaria subsp. sativa]